MNRKIIKFIIIVCLIFASANVFAEENAVTVSIETVTANVGSQFETNVLISNNSNICGGKITIKYDSAKLQIISVQATDLISSYTCAINKRFTDDSIRITWAGLNELKAGGSVAKISFMVLSTFTGNTDITISEIKLADSDGQKIDVSITDGEIVINNAKNNNTSEKITSSSDTISRNTDMYKNLTNDASAFSDIKSTDWFYNAVTFVYENNITEGISPNEYAPNDKVTRGQFITMLCRAYSIDEMKGNNFDDCGNTWYTGYLAAAKQLGISNGIGDNKFAPESLITREEMVTLIYNFLSINSDIEHNTELTFQDSDQVSDWAKIPVSYAASNKIVNGKENNIFDPKGYATRAELAQIFYNLFI